MRHLVSAIALFCCLAAPPAGAGNHDTWRMSADALGQVQPLKQILGLVRGSFPGEVLDARLFESNGAWFYEIKILGPDNRVVEIIVDAQTANLVSQR
jgi:uncharacterized membrane protein YkoI